MSQERVSKKNKKRAKTTEENIAPRKGGRQSRRKEGKGGDLWNWYHCQEPSAAKKGKENLNQRGITPLFNRQKKKFARTFESGGPLKKEGRHFGGNLLKRGVQSWLPAGRLK